MPLEKKLNAEPIRGYRLLEPLGSGCLRLGSALGQPRGLRALGHTLLGLSLIIVAAFLTARALGA